MKKIIVSVTNDLSGDQRVDRVCQTLTGMGFRVLLVGRKLSIAPAIKGRSYGTCQMRLIFNKGPMFYMEYNLRLFLLLLFSSFDLLLSNDLDTLPANRLAAFLKRKPVIYDSHEYFTEVPELQHRPRVRRIWEGLEKMLVPGVSQAYTVCESIARIYTEKYGIPFRVVRNFPMFVVTPEALAPGDEKSPATIIYQGALNLGRGLEQAINAMHYLPDARLIIAGTGDLENKLRKQVADRKLPNVEFTGKLAPEKLGVLTRNAQLGISVEEDMGLNYRYALPNKLFDYIQARIPVVVSNLPEMGAIVRQYDIGLTTTSHDPRALSEVFKVALTDKQLRQTWSNNLEKAARELTWENEQQIIKSIFGRYLSFEPHKAQKGT
ncbi:MAG TPA: glycosyltransferase [Prolixibacteraceae bacterium]|nr:glycosyltransferase [Prolixibacteraceae bacterium]